MLQIQWVEPGQKQKYNGASNFAERPPFVVNFPDFLIGLGHSLFGVILPLIASENILGIMLERKTSEVARFR